MMSSKKIAVSKLENNPFRDLERNPLNEGLVESLMDSIKRNDLWRGIVVRPSHRAKGFYQMAFGHHRIEAVRRLGIETIEVDTAELSDIKMIHFLRDENTNQGGNTAAAILESLIASKRELDRILRESDTSEEFLTQSEIEPSPGRRLDNQTWSTMKASERIGKDMLKKFLGEAQVDNNTLVMAINAVNAEYDAVEAEANREEAEAAAEKAAKEKAKADAAAEKAAKEKAKAEAAEKKAAKEKSDAKKAGEEKARKKAEAAEKKAAKEKVDALADERKAAKEQADAQAAEDKAAEDKAEAERKAALAEVDSAYRDIAEMFPSLTAAHTYIYELKRRAKAGKPLTKSDQIKYAGIFSKEGTGKRDIPAKLTEMLEGHEAAVKAEEKRRKDKAAKKAKTRKAWRDKWKAANTVTPEEFISEMMGVLNTLDAKLDTFEEVSSYVEDENLFQEWCIRCAGTIARLNSYGAGISSDRVGEKEVS